MNTTDSGTQDQSQGWTSGPNYRGTLDILWSCLFTIFLCIWSVQCLNIPALSDGYWTIARRKARWALLAIFGPEILLCFTIGQWASARRNLQAFHRLGYDDWTMTHAFFADMGGFHVQLPSGELYPLTGCHLHYLVYNKFIDLPSTTKSDIEDKSKADGWTKAITCLQTMWFLLQCLARAIKHHAVTTLELSTMGFVLCTLVTYYCWYWKPQDVRLPIVIPAQEFKIPLSDHLEPVPGQEHLSILDTVDDMRPSWSLTVMPHLSLPQSGPKERPFKRIPNDRLPEIGVRSQIVLCLITIAYASFHLLGWDFSFATGAEKWLWRGAAIVQAASTVIFWIFDEGQRLHTKSYMRPRQLYSHEQGPCSDGLELIEPHTASVAVAPQNQGVHAAQYASGVETPIQGHEVRGLMTSRTFPLSSKPVLRPYTGFRTHAASTNEEVTYIEDASEVLSARPSHRPIVVTEVPTVSSTACDLPNKGPQSTPYVPFQRSLDGHSHYDVPTWQVWITTSCTGMYALARAYLAVEVFIGLRLLPESAYFQVQWSEFIPGFS